MNSTKVSAEDQIRAFGVLLHASEDKVPALVGETLLHSEANLVSVGQGVERVREFLHAPPVRSAKVGLDWFHSQEKRDFDLALCEVLVPVFLPVVATAAMLVVMEDGARPIFAQERIGKNGKPFRMYKLRTMADTDGSGPSLGPDDPRATMVGRLLRASIVDEFPQLWNIHQGEMTWCSTRSLVGSEISRGMGSGLPRQGDLDLTMEEVLGPERYEDWYHGFYELVPGGLVSPFGNESIKIPKKDQRYFLKRAELDIWFREHGCLEVDLEHLKIKMDASLAAIERQLSAMRACTP
ncbi:sugar transferase [Actinomadura sp. WMMA1423]|uniref:sugar transferase n=1 Tax=Actinomadura sp. WMMA1423 TaxID=2591108 RepID=UPI00143D6DF5|nr:sugar transferase [Actinomadura sp. WMMA1423]